MLISCTEIVLSPNNKRVVLRPFEPSDDKRKLRIIARLSTLAEAEVDALLKNVLEEFHGRHQRPREFFFRRFEALHQFLLSLAKSSTSIRSCCSSSAGWTASV